MACSFSSPPIEQEKSSFCIIVRPKKRILPGPLTTSPSLKEFLNWTVNDRNTSSVPVVRISSTILMKIKTKCTFPSNSTNICGSDTTAASVFTCYLALLFTIPYAAASSIHISLLRFLSVGGITYTLRLARKVCRKAVLTSILTIRHRRKVETVVTTRIPRGYHIQQSGFSSCFSLPSFP